MGAAIWIVFQVLDDGGNPILPALEVNQPVMLFVAAALVAHRDAAQIVPPAVLRLLFQKGTVGRTLVQLTRLNLDDEATSWRGRFCFDYWHLSLFLALFG
jgi:hypothetical protein